MIGIDTFSWYKLLRLCDTGWKDVITEILEAGNFFITYDVRDELEYRFSEEKHYFQKVATLPRLNKSFNDYISRGYDTADASLLEYVEIKGYAVITEDQPMLNEGITKKLDLIQLADFFGSLMLQGVITRRELYHLVKFLRKIKNITKRKAEELLELDMN